MRGLYVAFRSLLHFLLGDDHVDGSLREIKQYQPIKSIALACYARVVKYLMARYGRSSEAALKALRKWLQARLPPVSQSHHI